jgi:alpha-glucosidase (family GH31 glycosyl hydrolase)
MDGRRDFTIDPVNFGDLPQLVDEVKKDGLRFIAIIVSSYNLHTSFKIVQQYTTFVMI